MPLFHVAFLPDGNRRWAKKHAVSEYEGHRRGLAVVAPKIIEASLKRGIHTVSLHPFSTENWGRSKAEIVDLMKVNREMLDAIEKLAEKYRARVIHLGRSDRLPKQIVKKLRQLENDTRNHQKHVINIALDYGGIDEILRAIGTLAKDAKGDPKKILKLLEHGLEPWLDTAGQPHPRPDLIVRTTEKRLSGFMAYQAAYSELFFSPLLWPDFTSKALVEALEDFAGRGRRFGK